MASAARIRLFVILVSASLVTYSPGFTDAHFDLVYTGMSTAEVERVVGKPLDIQVYRSGKEIWLYTRDNENRFFDVGWLGRWLHVSNGVVVGISKISKTD
jgi:hypothetical protein